MKYWLDIFIIYICKRGIPNFICYEKTVWFIVDAYAFVCIYVV